METTDALRELAGRVASQLVADALKRMVGAGAVTVTVHADAPVRLALPPKRRGGRKPGAKPKGKIGRPRKVVEPEPEAAPVAVVDMWVSRRCRKCKRPGATPVPGTERTLNCGHCGHQWDGRRKRSEPAAAGDAACGICDHAESAHIGDNGRCLSARCVCRGFHR
jgi:hypothetical protein